MFYSFWKKKLVKVVFPVKFEDGTLGTERLWCQKVLFGYLVDNIPFYVENIATGDRIGVKRSGPDLWFERLIKASGNSVIQLKISSDDTKLEIGKIFKDLGCHWEGSGRLDLISIHVPANIDYKAVSKILDTGMEEGKWDYKEACLGWK